MFSPDLADYWNFVGKLTPHFGRVVLHLSWQARRLGNTAIWIRKAERRIGGTGARVCSSSRKKFPKWHPDHTGNCRFVWEKKLTRIIAAVSLGGETWSHFW